MKSHDVSNYVIILLLLTSHMTSSAPSVTSSCENSRITDNDDKSQTIDIRMPQIVTKENDKYICTQFTNFNTKINNYILNYTPKAHKEDAHHMILYGCGESSSKLAWECSMGRVCPHGSKLTILYAWARDAEQLELPKDVGFRIGKDADITSLVLQIHYAHPIKYPDCSGISLNITPIPQKYTAGIYLMGSTNIDIPAHTTSQTHISCRHNDDNDGTIDQPLHVFAFRTHTHNLGRKVSAYRIRNGVSKLIGSGNPLWPQAFYSRIGGNIDIINNDVITATCYYQNNLDQDVQVGMTGNDEMCNFYMMYYTLTSKLHLTTNNGYHCWNINVKFHHYPQDNFNQTPYPGYAGIDSMIAIASGKTRKPKIPELIHHNHNGKLDSITSSSKNLSSKTIKSWLTDTNIQIGQVGGVSIDAKTGNVHIFHRAYRSWNYTSFTLDNIFSEQDSPITRDVILVIDGNTGKLKYQWGSSMFHMPHGITVHNDVVWLTDVALHQVFKYPIKGSSKALMTLGKRFQPGSDNQHFCKPTSTAIDQKGNIFIADGYCNSRVIQFDSNGKFISSWGKPTPVDSLSPPGGELLIAHDVKYIPLDGAVCVADRENGRVQCFQPESGKLMKIFENKNLMGNTIYALDFINDGKDGLLYIVTQGPTPSYGFTINYKTGDIVNKWPQDYGLNGPHTVAVSKDKQFAYVGQIHKPPMLIKIQFETTSSITSLGKSLVFDHVTSLNKMKSDYDNDDVIEMDETKLKKIKGSKTKNVMVLLLLAILLLVTVIITVFFFLSRNQQMKDYKRLMFDDDDVTDDHKLMTSSKQGKLNIGKMMGSTQPEHQRISAKYGEGESLINGHVRSDEEED